MFGTWNTFVASFNTFGFGGLHWTCWSCWAVTGPKLRSGSFWRHGIDTCRLSCEHDVCHARGVHESWPARWAACGHLKDSQRIILMVSITHKVTKYCKVSTLRLIRSHGEAEVLTDMHYHNYSFCVCAVHPWGTYEPMSSCHWDVEFAFAKSGTFIEQWPHPFWLSDMNVRAIAWCKNFIFTAASQVYNRLQIRNAYKSTKV